MGWWLRTVTAPIRVACDVGKHYRAFDDVPHALQLLLPSSLSLHPQHALVAIIDGFEPAGDAWLHEVKFAGYRCQLDKANKAGVKTRRRP